MQDPNPKWAHIFRWSVPSDEMYPTEVTSGGQEQNEDPNPKWAPFFRWSVPSDEMYSHVSDIWWPRAEWGHIFRWIVPSDEMYPHVSDIWWPRAEWAHIFRWSVPSDETWLVWTPSSPSIKPSGTEPYYTRSVWPPPLPHLNLVVQSPTTPG